MALKKHVFAWATIVGIAVGSQCSTVLAAVPLTPAGDGHVTVPALVNDQGPFAFVLDTGADESGVYHWFAKAVHLRAGKNQNLEGMTGSVSSPTYLLRTLSVDGRQIRNIVADSYPDRHDAGVQAGVAGNDLMDGTVAIFDFPCHTAEIHTKPVDIASLVPPQSVMVEGEAVREGTQLTLSVSINGVEASQSWIPAPGIHVSTRALRRRCISTPRPRHSAMRISYTEQTPRQ